MRPFTSSDLSECFTRADLLWLELPHKWFPQQFGESSQFFDTIMRRAHCPVVFVLHKPLSSPLLRIKWFREFLDSLNLSKCCTCCFGANTHCLVYMFSRGLVFEDRICAQRVPASIVTGQQELVVWKMFIENWLRAFFPITFHDLSSGEPQVCGPPPGLEELQGPVLPNQIFDPLLVPGMNMKSKETVTPSIRADIHNSLECHQSVDDRPSEAQQVADSSNPKVGQLGIQDQHGINKDTTFAFPTNSKEREQLARKAVKEAGIEVVLKKKRKFVKVKEEV